MQCTHRLISATLRVRVSFLSGYWCDVDPVFMQLLKTRSRIVCNNPSPSCSMSRNGIHVDTCVSINRNKKQCSLTVAWLEGGMASPVASDTGRGLWWSLTWGSMCALHGLTRRSDHSVTHPKKKKNTHWRRNETQTWRSTTKTTARPDALPQ